MSEDHRYQCPQGKGGSAFPSLCSVSVESDEQCSVAERACLVSMIDPPHLTTRIQKMLQTMTLAVRVAVEQASRRC